MPHYALKILIDLEARDDIEARQRAAQTVQSSLASVAGVREIVLHAIDDRKSIRLNPDGTFQDAWHKGGATGPK